MDSMTDQEVVAQLQSNTPANRARVIFRTMAGRIEQAQAQRSPASPIEAARMEFEAVAKIAETLGWTGLPNPGWESVYHAKMGDDWTERMRVPGGWLYRNSLMIEGAGELSPSWHVNIVLVTEGI